MREPFLLAILDGLGNNPRSEGNAVRHARTPTLDRLESSCPKTELITFGPRVGLPEGQMGNSEVGHLNIGGGRVVEQELLRINNAVAHNKLGNNPVLTEAFRSAGGATLSGAQAKPALHLIGLTSFGGVHSALEHIMVIVQAAVEHGVTQVFIHAITDGRDTPPQCAVQQVGVLVEFLQKLRAESGDKIDLRIASIVGRYFAMDRDKRWDRTKKAYDLFTLGRGEAYADPIAALVARHEANQGDEFLEPLIAKSKPPLRPGTVQDGDVVLFCNFRADRMRQIVTALSFPKEKFNSFPREAVPKLAGTYTLTEYEPHLPVRPIFSPFIVKKHFGEVVSEHGWKQLRIAETEKYPHVTYFFNGGVEEPLPGEERILIPSPRDVPTYDHKPQMSAYEVSDALLRVLDQGGTDIIILNYANCDMVGHTGNFPAAVKAVETVDTCLGRVLERLLALGGRAIVTADHGNAEQMIDYETGAPHTAHTTFPVPFYLVGSGLDTIQLRHGGALCDIAPTMCDALSLPQPAEMTGRTLIAC